MFVELMGVTTMDAGGGGDEAVVQFSWVVLASVPFTLMPALVHGVGFAPHSFEIGRSGMRPQWIWILFPVPVMPDIPVTLSAHQQ